MVGDECIAAIYRSSPHWITSTARGAEATGGLVSPEVTDISSAPPAQSAAASSRSVAHPIRDALAGRGTRIG